MTVKEIKALLKKKGYSYKQLSDLSGVPLSTIQKVMSGVTASPRYDTLRSIEMVLLGGSGNAGSPENSRYGLDNTYAVQEDSGTSSYNVYAAPEGASGIMREPSVYASNENGIHVKRQGEFTLEDYLALPDEHRVELIDGVFYDMAAPTGCHQLLAGEIFAVLRDQAREQKSPCRPMISPCDVQIDEDERTVVQPDVFSVCDFTRFREGRYFGAPELIIEVLSPSTRRKDMSVKTGKYESSGVREYWMVDLKEKRVLVNVFEEDILMHVYSITDDIPVHISKGKFHVDFGEIYQELISCFPETE